MTIYCKSAKDAFIEFIEYNGIGIDTSDENEVDAWFDHHFRGEWPTEAAFAQNVCVDQGLGLAGAEASAVEALENYIDWDYVAREVFFYHGDYTFIESGAAGGYVFEANC